MKKLLANDRGSVMIISMWIIFSLLCALLGLSAAVMLDHRQQAHCIARLQADQATRGAQVFLLKILETLDAGCLPSVDELPAEDFVVGDATFRLVSPAFATENELPGYCLEAENSRMNINDAPVEWLAALPGMTDELAAAIVDWRDADDEPTAGGAEAESYLRLSPPRLCKNAPFESIAELAMVYGMTNEILYGKDRNLNGYVDPWEVDNPAIEDFGILHFVTVFSKSGGRTPEGGDLVSVNSSEARRVLADHLSASQVQQVVSRTRLGQRQYPSLLDFYLRSGLSQEDFAKVEPFLSAISKNSLTPINVNTAPAEVLACLPGIDLSSAQSLVAWRRANADAVTSIAWILQVLPREQAILAAPALTTRSWQFRADISAVGRHGRGYRRQVFIFDTSGGSPVTVYARDLTGLGWAAVEDQDSFSTAFDFKTLP